MKTARTLLCLALMSALSASVSAQVFNFNIPAGNGTIPDGDQNGIVFQGPVSAVPTAGTPVLVGVSLNISGLSQNILANNGDLYVKLIAPSGSSAVLVNRPGRTPSSAGGYPDNGMNVFITDSTPGVTQDIHFYQNTVNPNFGQLTGSFQSDARDVSPTLVDGTQPRTLTLDRFTGQNMNGVWQLLAIDSSSGGQAQLNSWGLTFSNVPEPQAYALIAGLGLLGFAAYRRFAVKAA